MGNKRETQTPKRAGTTVISSENLPVLHEVLGEELSAPWASQVRVLIRVCGHIAAGYWASCVNEVTGSGHFWGAILCPFKWSEGVGKLGV